MTKRAELRTNAIEITVSGGFKTEHIFHTAGGKLGILELKALKAEGSYRGIDGTDLFFERTSFWKSHYQISEDGSVLGVAQPLKIFSRKFNLEFEGAVYQLVPGGSKLRSWSLLDSQGVPTCEIRPRGGFIKRGALILIFSEMMINLLVFGYCLVSRRWQEENSAA